MLGDHCTKNHRQLRTLRNLDHSSETMYDDRCSKFSMAAALTLLPTSTLTLSTTLHLFRRPSHHGCHVVVVPYSGSPHRRLSRREIQLPIRGRIFVHHRKSLAPEWLDIDLPASTCPQTTSDKCSFPEDILKRLVVDDNTKNKTSRDCINFDLCS